MLGVFLGTESIIIGLGGLAGSFLSILGTNKYIKTQGAMSSAPFYSKFAVIIYALSFVFSVFANYLFNYKLDNINYLYLFIFTFITWSVFNYFFKKSKTYSVDSFIENVSKYKILEKYNDDPKWATYLFFKNDDEGWNETISGSFRAKDPIDDLTFVFDTKEEALRYAKNTFVNAEYLES
jgi:hypothetical protein